MSQHNKDIVRTDEREWFTLQKCLDKVFTKSHIDSRDVKKGSASMCPLGEFNTQDCCIIELKQGLYIK